MRVRTIRFIFFIRGVETEPRLSTLSITRGPIWLKFTIHAQIFATWAKEPPQTAWD